MENFNINNLKAGYFVVYKKVKGNFYHRTIAIQQIKEGYERDTAEYIHVEPSLGKQWSIRAKFPKIVIINLLERHAGEYIKIVKPTLSDYSRRRKDVAIHCLTRVNLPYGIFGILWFKLKKVLKTNFLSSFGDFCSELSGFGIYSEYCVGKKKDTLDVLPKRFDELYPADFLDPNYFEVVWEGYLPKL